MIEVIFDKDPSATFLHLMITLIDMCRIYDVNSMTGYLFPSCDCSFAVVEVTVDFKDCIYQIRQRAYSKERFQNQLKRIAQRSLRNRFTIADPIRIIPIKPFDKAKLCEPILSAINANDSRSKVKKLRRFVDGILLSGSVDDHVSFMNTGNNIVLTLGEDYVIKVPTRASHSASIKAAGFHLKNGRDYRSYAVLPMWYDSVEIGSDDTTQSDQVKTIVLRAFIFPRLTSANLNFGNLVGYMRAVIKTVEFIHSQGVAHCDLRLPNIFFAQSDLRYFARLIDFDLSSDMTKYYEDDWKRAAKVLLDMIIVSCRSELDLLENEKTHSIKAQKLRVAVDEVRCSRKRLREDDGGGDVENTDTSNTVEESLVQDTVTRCRAISAQEGFQYLLKGGPSAIRRQIIDDTVLDGLFLQITALINFVG